MSNSPRAPRLRLPRGILRGILNDVRLALRLLWRSPLFTITSVLSLAIGIASTTLILGVTDGVLYQSPGVRDPAGVVHVGLTTNGSGYGTMSFLAFRYLRDHTQTLENLAATTLEDGMAVP